MTTKTNSKTEHAAAPRGGTPTRDEIRIAYQVHTLSHMLYGQMTTAGGWNAVAPYGYGFEAHYGYPTQPSQPMTPSYPVTWGYPYGWYR